MKRGKLYSPITGKSMKLRRIKGTDNVGNTDERKDVYRILVGNLRKETVWNAQAEVGR
jgi:hypothetical protein